MIEVAYKTLKEALDESEKIISGARCLVPHSPPDGKPTFKSYTECPHCKALALIRKLREENNL
jgi:hypothetical protein